MLQSYRRLFAVPHLGSLLFWSLVARLHIGGMPIAVTFLVAGWTGSYAIAGLVSGALTVGTALGGPIRGRMADHRPADRLLAVSAVVYGAGLAVLALLPASLWWAAVPLSLVTGVFLPPASQIARSLWPRVLTGRLRQSMYAAEATLQELLFIIGPLLAAAVVGVAGGRAGVAVLTAVSCAGALGFAWALRGAGHTLPPSAAADAAPVPGGARGSLLADRGILLVLAMCTLLVAGLGGVDLVMVAWSRELGSPGYAGVLMAVYAAGSLVGGLVAGGLSGPPRLPRRAFAAAVGVLPLIVLLPPIAHVPSPWLVAPVLFVAGLAIAPTLAAVTERLGDLAPPHRRGEAFGWLTTANTAGISVAAPVTGWLIDAGGAAAGVAGATAFALAAACLSVGVAATRPAGSGPATGGPPPTGPTGPAGSALPPGAP
ncbi:MFS transporter [Nocardiopsis mangrovi]|uniref:MFS transporter n=1 Tax=Nocardiopsis mangrovi TaxID=1179818 RepID=A0ABV9DQT4_9ACTN